ncbi:hypothetical protein [Peribacillus loiseleuriae]|uniref:ACT domain-containing protein n=1 Tax=Peribacillus loiseleuriae TaxID=1679170 RepID=A0A0K9GUC8_9BACI|nr:hypothetical protein [Peribacillus loiseleuriae]KMY50228.1 hypothetical protein AC625_12570 [Peribacillus loiseleuriae]
MNKKKNGYGFIIKLLGVTILLGIFIRFTPFLPFLSLSLGGPEVSNNEVRNYVKDKYGIAVYIESKSGGNDISIGEAEYTVVQKNNKDVTFTVKVNYLGDKPEISDDYKFALEAHKEFKRLKPVIPDIHKLGFQGRYSKNGEIYIDYTGNQRIGNEDKNIIGLSLKTETNIEYKPFTDDEVDRYYQLAKLIQKSKADIDEIYITDMREPAYSNGVSMGNLDAIKTKEDFIVHLKAQNSDIASYEVDKKWETEARKIENQRFVFGSEYEDFWLNCGEPSGKGDCGSYSVIVTYEENGLNQTNPHLKDDLNSVFLLLEQTIAPKIKVNYEFVEGGESDVAVRFTHQEHIKYKTTEELIKELFPKN